MVKNWLSQAWIKAFLSENLPGACAGREPQDPDRLRPRRAHCGAASVQPGPALISPSPSPHRRKGAPDGFRLSFTEHPDRCRLSLTDTEGAPRPLQAQPHRCRGSTQTATGSASQTQREHPDHFRLSLTDAEGAPRLLQPQPHTEGAPRPLQAQPHRHRGSTQTAAGSASQMQREHPDRCRLSLTDAEAALRPFQAQPHRQRGSTQTTSGSASQMQREHPDHFRLSLIDTEGAPRLLQAQPQLS